MTTTLTDVEFNLFKEYILKKCGIDIPPEKAYLIETRLSKLLVDTHSDSFNELYRFVMKNDDKDMPMKIINAITTNETMWFRDKSPWAILENLLLPRFIGMLRTGERKKIRIWSAASSTGQEAYSIAMCIDKYIEDNRLFDIKLSQFEIIATDISEKVIDIAKKAKYDTISIMRGLDNSYKEKYFTKDGLAWRINDKIKNMVNFSQFNLQNDFTKYGKFDVVFCRYVLIYFSTDFKKEIITKIHGVLHDEGTLFIGNYILLDQLEREFQLKNYANSTYYLKKVVIL